MIKRYAREDKGDLGEAGLLVLRVAHRHLGQGSDGTTRFLGAGDVKEDEGDESTSMWLGRGYISACEGKRARCRFPGRHFDPDLLLACVRCPDPDLPYPILLRTFVHRCCFPTGCSPIQPSPSRAALFTSGASPTLSGTNSDASRLLLRSGSPGVGLVCAYRATIEKL